MLVFARAMFRRDPGGWKENAQRWHGKYCEAEQDALILRQRAAELQCALRVALRYIETETCGAPEGTIRHLHDLAQNHPRPSI